MKMYTHMGIKKKKKKNVIYKRNSELKSKSLNFKYNTFVSTQEHSRFVIPVIAFWDLSTGA